MSKTPQNTLTTSVHFPAELQLQVSEVGRVPLIMVRRDAMVAVFFDNCPDENLPLKPVLNSLGQIVCTQHGARFDCAGCLVHSGAAHHADRCEQGLQPVPAEAVELEKVMVTITPELLQEADRIAEKRRRRQKGGSLRRLVRSLFAWLGGR
jgi:nitrite reductase/ring-hydroxylating ferredoxin subunit